MTQKPLPLINYQLCDLCGACVTSCPEDALSMTSQGPVFNRPVTCTYCTKCETACPTGAIRAPLTVLWATEHPSTRNQP